MKQKFPQSALRDEQDFFDLLERLSEATDKLTNDKGMQKLLKDVFAKMKNFMTCIATKSDLEFLYLADVDEEDFVGHADDSVVVNASENGLIFDSTKQRHSGARIVTTQSNGGGG